MSSVLLFRFCSVLVDCFVDFLPSLGSNARLAKRLAAMMNFAIFLRGERGSMCRLFK